MAARKPPRTASLLRAPAPPAAEDPKEVERFIRGEGPPGAPHGAPERSTTPHDAPRRSATSSGPGSRDGSRAFQRWSDGSEARKHTVYLPVLVSEDLLRACRDDGRKVSKAFEEAVTAWLEARDRTR